MLARRFFAEAFFSFCSTTGFASSTGTVVSGAHVEGSVLSPRCFIHSYAQVLTLGNRAPAGLPKAQAGNGVPDLAFAALPGYEPRLSGVTAAAPVASAQPGAAFAHAA